MANYDQKEYLRRIISDALQGETQESEYSMGEEQAGEQYKIAKADYEAFREKYSIKKDQYGEDNIYQLISDVNANCQPITITNNKGRNAVLIGEEDWRTIEETLFLMSIPNMTESIINGGNTPLEECLSEDEVEW